MIPAIPAIAIGWWSALAIACLGVFLDALWNGRRRIDDAVSRGHFTEATLTRWRRIFMWFSGLTCVAASLAAVELWWMYAT